MPVMWHVRKWLAIETDTRRHKKGILIAQAVIFVLAFPMAVLHLWRYGDVLTADENREAIKEGYGFQTVPPGEALVYD